MNLLFVYGTLRHSSDHPKAKYLRERARFVGEGTICACLYNLGPYPGIVPGSAGSLVHGDVFEMTDADEMLSVLDEYENAATGHRQLFRRDLVKVCLNDGTERDAWVYWYAGDVSTAERIESGIWLAARR
jgi:gamma-glutamylcyclotransferase (GGCT)/AIG2-like uncharacterized protein YtfP